MTSLYRLLPAEVDSLVQECGQPAYRAGQLLGALYGQSPTSIDDLRQLPAGFRTELTNRGFTIDVPSAVARSVSKDGETTKLLLAMPGGVFIETVLMQYHVEGKRPRSTVCVSTQAGCAMGCVFCATGQMGFERNLAAEEIVAQVVHFARLLRERGEHVTNIVFMGMGEPLANYAETIRAVRLLTHPRAFGLGQRSITISTVGVIRGIDRLAAEGLQVNLAISLHAPNETLRQRLVPTAGPHSVADLVAAAKRFFEQTGRRVTFEYALIAGVNDAPGLADALAKLLRGAGAHVNLIPVNPTAGGFQEPARGAVLEFERRLRLAGVNCTVRVEKGSEIAAACGQLRTDALAGGPPIPLRAVPRHGSRQSRAAPVPSQTQ